MNKTLLLKASIIGCLLFSTMITSAQENQKRHTMGISAGLGQADFIQPMKDLRGAPSYNARSLSKYGLYYAYTLKRGVELETGIYYLVQGMDVENKLYPDGTNESAIRTNIAHRFELLSIPLGIRVNFLKYLFWNSAALIDIDVSNTGGIRDQSSIGVNLGIGANYFFKNNLGIFINPQVAHRSLYYFKGNGNSPWHIEYNTSFGLAYKL